MTPFTTQFNVTTDLSQSTKFSHSTDLPNNGTIAHTSLHLSNSDIVVIFIYVLVFAVGSCGNILVIRYFGFCTKSKHSYNIYLIHLAVSDLLSATITPVHFVYMVLSKNMWHFGSASCKLVSVIGPVTVNVSSWILVSIAFERYRGIVTPFKPRWSKCKINLTVAMIWVVSLLTLIPYMFAMRMTDGMCIPDWKAPTYELTSAVGTLILQSILPIAFMIFAVSRMLNALKKRLPKSNPSKVESMNRTAVDTKIASEGDNRANKYSSSSSTTSWNSKYSFSSKQNSLKVECSKYNSCKVEHSIHQSLTVESKFVKSYSAPNLNNLMSSSSVVTSVPKMLKTKNNTMIKIQVHKPKAVMETITEKEVEYEHKRLLKFQFDRQQGKNLEFDIKPLINTSRKKSVSMGTGMTLYGKESKLYANSFDNFFGTTREVKGSRKMLSSTYRKLRTLLSMERKKEKTRNENQRQIISMLIVTFSVFIVCCLPYNVFYVVAVVLLDFLKLHSTLDVLSRINYWLSTLVVANSIMNCYIYAGMNAAFRQYCCSLITFKKEKNKK